MNAQDLFGVIVRVFGLGFIGYGFRYLMSYFYAMVRQSPGQGWTGSDYLFAAVLFVAIGFCLLRGADCVVKFAYPRGGNQKNDAKHGDEVV